MPVPFVVVFGRLAFELRYFVAVGRGDDVLAAFAAQLGAVDDDILAARHLPLAGAVALIERLARLLLLFDQLGTFLFVKSALLAHNLDAVLKGCGHQHGNVVLHDFCEIQKAAAKKRG